MSPLSPLPCLTPPPLHPPSTHLHSPPTRRVIFRFILKVFFRRVDVLNLRVLPTTGPVIIVGNHANQFIDGMALVASTPRAISFLMAQKSYNRRYIGDVAKAMRCVPVTRPQDLAKKGQGKVTSLEVDPENPELYIARGTGCNFKAFEWKKGSKLRCKEVGELLVEEGGLRDDNTIVVKKPKELKALPEGGAVWQFLPKVDQKVVFNRVFDLLAKSGTVGMFPEGGSHDQGHLIPLKAGVTIMALGAAVQGTPVK